MKLTKSLLVDIDGCACNDIKNEDAHLFPTAKVIEGAVEKINKLYDEGHTIVFFTARTSEHRDVTLEWLNKAGFKFHGLITDKPRGNLTIIDNLEIKTIKFDGDWSIVE